MSSEIKDAIDFICEEKHIKFERIMDAINQSLAAAYRKDYAKEKNLNIKADFNIETGNIKVWDSKVVCENYELDEEENVIQPENTPEEDLIRFNSKVQLMIKDAREIKKDAKIGDVIDTELESPSDFGRVAAQTAKQVIIQKIKEAEKESILSEFQEKEKTIVIGAIQKVENDMVFVNLGHGVGIVKREDQIEGETYTPGSKMKFYVKIIEESPKGIQILLSRSNAEFAKHLFMLEIPEISDGIVVIKNIAREAGSRSKVAVTTAQENIDPIGSCVGQKGIRINAIMNELGNEKLDIIEYDKDINIYIANALLPAKILSLTIDEQKKEAQVMVSNDQFSLAIGKKGQNVRLASRLTGFKINITPENQDEIKPKEEIVTEEVVEEKIEE